MYTKYLDDVELRLYEGCRHELHSEENKEEVFQDIYNWIEEHERG
jgi:alpha-beta hydrolase superfamily lysophospholipase